MTWLQARSMFE